MGADRQHGITARHEVDDPGGSVGSAQLDHGQLERLFTNGPAPAIPNDFLQLAAKEQIAAFHEHTFSHRLAGPPQSFASRWTAATDRAATRVWGAPARRRRAARRRDRAV